MPKSRNRSRDARKRAAKKRKAKLKSLNQLTSKVLEVMEMPPKDVK